MGYSFWLVARNILYAHLTDRITHTTAFVTHVVEYCLEQEIAQWIHHDGSIRRPIAPWATELHLWLPGAWNNLHLSIAITQNVRVAWKSHSSVDLKFQSNTFWRWCIEGPHTTPEFWWIRTWKEAQVASRDGKMAGAYFNSITDGVQTSFVCRSYWRESTAFTPPPPPQKTNKNKKNPQTPPPHKKTHTQ